MLRQRRAKIIATLGPSSSTPEMIEKLFLTGVDVFRLNFSHGTHEEHKKNILTIRNIEEKTGWPIGIMLDLQGPKLRIDYFQDDGVHLTPGDIFTLDLNDRPGTKDRVYFPHPEIYSALSHGNILLIDDGKICLQIQNVTSSKIETVIKTGGWVSHRKGVNVPDVLLPISALSDKDRKDAIFGLECKVDWIALSFVQKPEDIIELRNLIGKKTRLLSKIEKPLAIDHLQNIIDLSDGIMVARGDLGVEIPPEKVPSLQKKIIQCCREAGKPVIVATQMLDSMVKSPTPTRAEASDVATAIYDGADTVMLSAESASGQYPLEAVTIMDRIIKTVEQDPFYIKVIQANQSNPKPTISDAISAAARQSAHTIGASVIVTFTSTGSTTLRAARERPECPILALTPSLAIARQLTLVWGVHSLQSGGVNNFNEIVSCACQFAKEKGFANEQQDIVIMAGVPCHVAGTTNILHIAHLTSDK